MPKFIEATGASTGKPRFIQVAHIVEVYPEKGHTAVSLLDRTITYLSTQYEEVVRLVKEATDAK